MKDIFDLKDKVVVVFGGSGLLGQTFSKALVDYNAKVVSCDIQPVAEDKKLKEIDYRVIDASEKDVLNSLRDSIVEKYGRVDVLISSLTAKHNDFYLPFDQASIEGWQIGLDGNLTIPVSICQTFIPVMEKQNSGSIILISSIYGIVGNDQNLYAGSNLHEIYVKESPEITQIYSHGVYNAAKAGLINFARYLAAYYGKNNIRVNCISPGGVKYEKENETFVAKYNAKTPLGRKANPEDINGGIIYLASDASSYVTGHNLVIDGGFTIW